MSDVQQRIDELVKGNPVLLFMKGSASFPMCGFSGRAIQILKACGVDPKSVKTVNVLDDAEIRQGIKTYSNWPIAVGFDALANFGVIEHIDRLDRFGVHAACLQDLDGSARKTAHGETGAALHEQQNGVAFDQFVDALLNVTHAVLLR